MENEDFSQAKIHILVHKFLHFQHLWTLRMQLLKLFLKVHNLSLSMYISPTTLPVASTNK